MKKSELKQLIREEISKILNESNPQLQSLIDEFRTSTNPDNEYYDYEGRDSEEILRDIRNGFGDKIADQVSDGEFKMHQPRGGWKSRGTDKLSIKQDHFNIIPNVTTKTGKMHKGSINKMKNYYKRGY